MDTELIHRYLKGVTSSEEERCILAWLDESETNRIMFANILAMDASYSVSGGSDDSCEKMLGRLNSRIDSEGPGVRKLSSAALAWTVAAVMTIFAAFSIMSMLRPEYVPEDEIVAVLPHEFANDTDHISQFVLEDGSKLFLVPGSKLRYDMGRSSERVAVLEGEAYFEVAKDSLRPFVVKTDVVDLQVLGTSFTMKNGAGISDTEIVLERGSVRLLSPEGHRLVTLRPDQKAVIHAGTADVTVEDINAVPYITEKYNLVSMLGADLNQIVRMIEQIYSVKIGCSKVDSDKRYDINFLKTDELQDVIAIVEYISDTKLSVTRGI